MRNFGKICLLASALFIFSGTTATAQDVVKKEKSEQTGKKGKKGEGSKKEGGNTQGERKPSNKNKSANK